MDLGASYLIDSLTIYDFCNKTAQNLRYQLYSVSLCNDNDFTIENQSNANWTSIGETDLEADTFVTDFELSRKMIARYIKLDNLKTLNYKSFGVCELEAFGMEFTDIESVKKYAVNEIYSYKTGLELNSTETEARNNVLTECSNHMNSAETVEDILAILNEDNLFADNDREVQVAALE